jgi:hypothetical protein
MFLFIYFEGTVVGTQDFTLAKQTLSCLSHISSPFYSGCFWRWSLANYLPGLAILLISASQRTNVLILVVSNSPSPNLVSEEYLLCSYNEAYVKLIIVSMILAPDSFFKNYI